MSAKDALGDAARLEQHEAQQHRVADSPPNGPYGVAAGGGALNEYCIDRHAHQNEHPLERHGKQGFQVVLPRPAQLPVGEGRHGDGGKAGEQIYFNHAAIHQHKNNDVQGRHGDID